MGFSPRFFVVAVVAAAVLSMCTTEAADPAIHSALMELFHSCGGAAWKNSTGWGENEWSQEQWPDTSADQELLWMGKGKGEGGKGKGGKGKGGFKGNCYYCNQPGHCLNQCPQKDADMAKGKGGKGKAGTLAKEKAVSEKEEQHVRGRRLRDWDRSCLSRGWDRSLGWMATTTRILATRARGPLQTPRTMVLSDSYAPCSPKNRGNPAQNA